MANSEENSTSLIRLQKVLADAGIASRRGSEALIAEGRVTVDGEPVLEMGRKIDPKINKVQVDGETIKLKKSKTYLAFHKPAGVISTMSDPDGRPNLGEYFKDRNERLFHVGRLDKESEGLILLTNDGDFAHKATHPSFGLVKKYVVEIIGPVTKETIRSLETGIELEDGLARALNATVIREVTPKHFWIELSIHEGRFHIVRRMFEALDLEVTRLIRNEFGPVLLGETKVGRWRALSEGEIERLFTVLHIKR